jgi:hypothetical protein
MHERIEETLNHRTRVALIAAAGSPRAVRAYCLRQILPNAAIAASRATHSQIELLANALKGEIRTIAARVLLSAYCGEPQWPHC